MLQALGMILVAAGCGALGFQASARLRERERALRELESGLLLLEQELALNQTPLPRLMETLERRTAGEAAALFGDCRTALDRLDQRPFADSWRELVAQREALGPEGRELLYPLGQTLGRYEGEEQRRAVCAVRAAMGELTCRAEGERRRLGRVYQTLGLSGGGVLVILLI